LALVGLALRRSRQWSMASLARTRAAAARVHGRRFETSGVARLDALKRRAPAARSQAGPCPAGVDLHHGLRPKQLAIGPLGSRGKET
jgi:hypothetical protein